LKGKMWKNVRWS